MWNLSYTRSYIAVSGCPCTRPDRTAGFTDPGGTTLMSDRYSSLIRTPVGQLLAKNLGLPNPVPLERYQEGDPLVDGTVVLGGNGRLSGALTDALDDLGIASVKAASEGERYQGLVFDATGIESSAGLVELQRFFTPLMRSLEQCARIVVLGTPPEMTNSR